MVPGIYMLCMICALCHESGPIKAAGGPWALLGAHPLVMTPCHHLIWHPAPCHPPGCATPHLLTMSPPPHSPSAPPPLRLPAGGGCP